MIVIAMGLLIVVTKRIMTFIILKLNLITVAIGCDDQINDLLQAQSQQGPIFLREKYRHLITIDEG